MFKFKVFAKEDKENGSGEVGRWGEKWHVK
jgi:hypothetical protein